MYCKVDIFLAGLFLGVLIFFLEDTMSLLLLRKDGLETHGDS